MSAIEEFLASEDGKRVLASMDYEYTAGDSGLRALLAIESDKYTAEKRRGDKLERAVREVQAQGAAVLTVIRSSAPNIDIQPEWVMAFNRNQPADSPMRAPRPSSSARSHDSQGAESSGSASRRMSQPAGAGSPSGTGVPDFYFL